MTLYIQLDNDFTYGSRFVDPILTNGSLVLLEPAIDGSELSYELVNYADKPLKSLGLTNSSTVPLVSGNNQASFGNNGMLEKTAKGGLHGIVSQGKLSWLEKAQLSMPEILQYMQDNNTHDFALFTTLKVTRDLGEGNRATYFHPLVGAVSLDFGVYQSAITQKVDPLPRETPPQIASISDELRDGVKLVGVARNGIGSSNINIFGGWGWIGYRDYELPSYILYRLYVEDLTVSGRTFDDVAEQERNIVNKKFEATGVYYNDTYTDPNSTAY